VVVKEYVLRRFHFYIRRPESSVKDPMFHALGAHSTKDGPAIIKIMMYGREWFERALFVEELNGALMCSAHTFRVEGAEEGIGHTSFAMGLRNTKIVHNTGLVAFIIAGIFTEYTANKTAVMGSCTYTDPGAVAKPLL
jgi:hypothetical protein